jgi:hypothetical protein
MKPILPKLSVIGLIVLGLLFEIPPFDKVLIKEAEARVGRPASPSSVAGVARRTTRRIVRRHHAIGHRVKILPVGYTTVVVRGTTYYVYDRVYYRAYYEGNQVVYIVVEQP